MCSTKKVTDTVSSLQVGICVWAGILLTHLPLSLLVGEVQMPVQMNRAWAAMLAYAVVGLAAFWLVIEGFRHIDASLGGLVGLLEVLAGVAFGVALTAVVGVVAETTADGAPTLRARSMGWM